MITYEEALEIAIKRKENTDCCKEYETAYLFSSEEDAGFDGGYGHGPLVISKEDGSFQSLPTFLMKGEKVIREIPITRKYKYVEPADYFPKELREKYFGKDKEES